MKVVKLAIDLVGRFWALYIEIFDFHWCIWDVLIGDLEGGKVNVGGIGA
jgi:hypothetical protein